MKYALIYTGGQLVHLTGDWTTELGPEGFSRVGLHPALPMAGWVNDKGHNLPELYPRNVIGSVLLGCLGAAHRPYAGPVVITGFRTTPEPDPADLQSVFAAYLENLHGDIGRALEGRPPADAERNTADWAMEIRRLAVIARAGEAPPLRFLPVDSLPGFGGPN